MLRRLVDRLKRVEREKVSWCQAVVTDNDPLTIKLKGSDTEVRVQGIDGIGYDVNAVVTVLVRDADMLALGASTGSPSPPEFGTQFATDILSAPGTTAATANRQYFARVHVLHECTLTGVEFFPLSATGTARVALYDSTGARVANRTTDSGTLSLAVTRIAFDSTYNAAPGVYYVGVIYSSTPNLNMAAVIGSNFVAGPGSSATATSITPPTGVAASVPVMSTY